MREIAGSTRFLRGTAATLTIQVYEDGVAVTPDGTPAVKVTIVTGDGVTLVDNQDATLAGSLATYDLTPTQTADVNTLTATWTIETADGEPVETFTTEHEIIGDFLFTIADARAWEGGELADSASYPDAAIRSYRDGIQDAFEQITKHAWGLRFRREIHDGDGSDELLTKADDVQTVRAAATRSGSTWTALTADQLADVLVYPYGALVRESSSWPAGRRNVRVDLEIGRSIPLQLRTAALRILRHWMTTTDIPDRAIMEVSENGTYQLAVAGRQNAWFGIPDVDSVLARYRSVVVR